MAGIAPVVNAHLMVQVVLKASGHVMMDLAYLQVTTVTVPLNGEMPDGVLTAVMVLMKILIIAVQQVNMLMSFVILLHTVKMMLPVILALKEHVNMQILVITAMVHVLMDMKMTVQVHVHHPALLPVGKVMAGVMMVPMVCI
jgi:hypothetical protein|tara:strand:+ start:185 stop:610 length:426 start_codon:yes stop_codon:yes gene_type:complete